MLKKFKLVFPAQNINVPEARTLLNVPVVDSRGSSLYKHVWDSYAMPVCNGRAGWREE
jgi:hypothetical protein